MNSPETALAGQGSAPQDRKLVERLQGKPWWRWLSFPLGLLVSGVFLYLALRGANFALVWQELQAASHIPLVLAVCVGMVGNLIRAVRWGVLLGYAPPARLRFLFTSMMIGYLANNVLPARAGELVRIYVLERKVGVSKSTSAATVVVERLTDVLVLLAMVGVLSLFLPLPAVIRSGSQIATVIFIAIAIWLLFLALRGKSLLRLAAQRVASLSHGLGQRVQGILERFVDGLSVLRSSRQALFVLMLTLVIWGIEAVSVGLVMRSLNLGLPWIASLFVLVVLSLGFVIPAAPGALGTYEFFVVTALTPFAVNRSEAVGLALVLHAAVYIASTAQGLLCLWAESLPLREVMTGVHDSQDSFQERKA